MDLPVDSSDFWKSTYAISIDERLSGLDRPSHHRLTLAILVLASIAAVYQFIFHPLFISPLSKIPAPHWSCHVCGLWLLWAKFQERENRAVLAGHRKHGPILRISPNMVHFNSAEGIKTIYLGNFPRSHWYWGAFRNYEVLHMVTVEDAAEHALRRKKFSAVFSKSAMLTSETLQAVSETVLMDRLVPLLQELERNEQPLETFKTIYGVGMDLFVGWQFGLASSSNWTQNTDERDEYLNAYNGKAQYFFIATEAIAILDAFMEFGISLLPKEFWRCNDVCEKWNMDLGDRAARTIAENATLGVHDEPVLFRHALKTMCGFTDGLIPKELGHSYPYRKEVACEMFSFNAAAHEGAGIPLTWIAYELSHRPHLQERLRKELATLPISLNHASGDPGTGRFPLAKDFEALALLDAIVMETLRRYPVIGGPQPRRVPASMSIANSPIIPAGTIVQSSAWSLHHNPEVFPEPESWNPDRWLDATSDELATMRKWFFTFSNGPTMCIGRHWMTLSLKMIVALIYANYTTSIYEHCDMAHRDGYLTGPMDQERFSVILKAV